MGRLGRGRLSEGCRNKIQKCTFYSVNWRCRSTNIFSIIFLNFEIYCIVPKKLGDILFHIVSPQTMLYIVQMQCMYMYDFLQTLFHTAILGGEGTVMKISTKCNRCGLLQSMSELSG